MYRWCRRIFVWTFALAVFGTTAAALLALRFYADPDQVRLMLSSAAPKWLPNSVLQVGRTRVQALNGVTLHDILLRLKDEEGKLRDILTLERIRIVPDSRALASGEIRIPRVAAEGPKLHIHFDQDGKCQWFGPTGKAIAFAEPASFLISKGEVKISCERPDQPPVVLTDVEGSVELLPPATAKFEVRGKHNEAKITLAAEINFAMQTLVWDRLALSNLECAPFLKRMPDTMADNVKNLHALPKFNFECSGDAHWDSGHVRANSRVSFGPADENSTATTKLAGGLSFDSKTKELQFTDFVVTDLLVEKTVHLLPAKLQAKIPNVEELAGKLSASANGFLNLTDPQKLWNGNAEVDLREGKWKLPRSALNVSDVTAAIHLSRESVEVKSFSSNSGFGRIAGKAICPNWNPKAAELFVEADTIPFSPEIYNALPERQQAVWKRFSPEGSVGVRGAFTFMGDQPKFVGTCIFSNNAATYDRFTYRVTDIAGLVQFQPDGRIEVDLIGKAGSAEATLVGSAANLDPDAHMDLALTAKNVTIDNELRKAFDALPDGAASAVQKVHGSGVGNAFARIRRQAGSIYIRTDVEAQLDMREFSAEWFPLSLDRVTGEVMVTRDRIEFRKVRGTSSNGLDVTMEGWSQNDGRFGGENPTKGSNVLQLDFWARDVPLNAEVRRALPQVWHRVWDHLRPEGYATLTCRLYREGTSAPRLAFRFDLNNAAITPYSFAYRLHSFDGPFELRNSELTWGKLAFRHDNTVWTSTGGHVRADDRGGEVHFRSLASPSLPIDADLARAVPSAVRTVLEFLAPTKPAQNLVLDEFTVAWDSNGSRPPSIELGNGRASFRNARLFPSIGATDVTAHIALHGSCMDSPVLKGNVEIESMKLASMTATDIKGRLNVDGSEFHFDNLHGKIHDGELHVASLRAALSPVAQYETRMSIMNASLKEYVRRAWNAELPLNARVNANLYLYGGGPTINRLTGNGTLDMRDVDLLQLPVLIDQLHFLVSRLPDGKPFDAFHADFDILDDKFVIRKMDMSNTTMKLSMRNPPGYMQMGSGALDLDMVPSFFRSGLRIPLINDSASFHVGGTIFDPLVTPRPFSGTLGGIKKVLTPVMRRE